jgi:hypothetical protein
MAKTPARPQIDVQHLAELERIERRFELALRDLRLYRAGQIRSLSDRGVLGARDLTAFILELLKMAARCGVPKPGFTVQELLRAAEGSGYAVPTARTLSKRLTTRAYRTGDIIWMQNRSTGDIYLAAGYWFYKGDTQS